MVLPHTFKDPDKSQQTSKKTKHTCNGCAIINQIRNSTIHYTSQCAILRWGIQFFLQLNIFGRLFSQYGGCVTPPHHLDKATSFKIPVFNRQSQTWSICLFFSRKEKSVSCARSQRHKWIWLLHIRCIIYRQKLKTTEYNNQKIWPSRVFEFWSQPPPLPSHYSPCPLSNHLLTAPLSSSNNKRVSCFTNKTPTQHQVWRRKEKQALKLSQCRTLPVCDRRIKIMVASPSKCHETSITSGNDKMELWRLITISWSVNTAHFQPPPTTFRKAKL